MKTLFLVDVSSMFFRAFFAIPPLKTKEGFPTNALYGLLSMSVKLMRDVRPDYIAYCFDRKEPSFRAEIYPEYKANREEMPDLLAPQIPYVREIIEALGVPCLEAPGFEADDVIGTLAVRAAAEKMKVVIVSGDKDFAQLITECISMWDTMKDVKYDVQGAIGKWGVHPTQMIDYLSLVGDSSDNIPGVRGIGPKTAQTLLAEFKSLEGIYENIEAVKSKSVKSKLQEDKSNALLSHRLVTIETKVPLPIEIQMLKPKAPQRPVIEALLNRFEFGTFLKKIFPPNNESQAPVERAMAPSETSIEKETMGLNPGDFQNASSMSEGQNQKLANQNGIREISPGEFSEKLKERDSVWAVFHMGYVHLFNQETACRWDLLESQNPDWQKLHLQWHGFDLKEIWHQLKISNPSAVVEDLQLSAYVCKSGDVGDLSEAYKDNLHREFPDFASPIQIAAAYFELKVELDRKLREKAGHSVLQDLELPLVPVLYGMEERGILIDVEELRHQSQKLGRSVHELEKEIHRLAGTPFNVASPKQLGSILFEKLGLPSGKKTKTGYSTDSDVLEKLSDQHPICKLVLEYRELAKLKSTYVDSLPELRHADGRIHTHFRQALTSTGRLSSVNPNLQNIPIRTERGRDVRKAFIAKEGCVFVALDYSQIELRILAHISEDPGLISAFVMDTDVHAATASEVFGVPLQDVSADLRRTAKAINFGIAYGQGAFGLAENLGISRTEATDIINRYFQKFSQVKSYMSKTIQLAMETGYVETLFGRRRYIDELQSKNANIKKFGERAAINAPIQGTASDIVKKAMILVSTSDAQGLLLQVHDELLFEVPHEEAESLRDRMKAVMESVVKLRVPLKVNGAIGKNWELAHS